MTHSRHHQGPRDWRSGLLAGAAFVALGLGGPAMAQQQGSSSANQASGNQASGSGQAQQGTSQVAGQLRSAAQSLRDVHGQVSGGQQQTVPQQALQQARQAVDSGMNALNQVPQQTRGQDVWRNAERELKEARQALQGDRPQRQQAATKLSEAADALGTLAGRVGGSADASGTDGQQARMQVGVQQPPPQVTVQQQQPQITVTQPAPQVSVQQPPPQVNVQQPPPQVNVQQAEPRVTVQRAEPQVTVQQAQPQVTVQRQGEPQVTTRRPGDTQGQAQQDAQSRQNNQGQNSQGQNNQSQQDSQARQNNQRQQDTQARQPAPAQRNMDQRASIPASPDTQARQQAAVQPAGVPLRSVEALVGTNVVGADGREAGEVRNLLIGDQGRVRAAVVEWGGFLGVGTREALVPIERINLGRGNEQARLTMTKEELEALPSYDRDSVNTYGRQRGWGDNARLYR